MLIFSSFSIRFFNQGKIYGPVLNIYSFHPYPHLITQPEDPLAMVPDKGMLFFMVDIIVVRYGAHPDQAFHKKCLKLDKEAVCSNPCYETIMLLSLLVCHKPDLLTVY